MAEGVRRRGRHCCLPRCMTRGNMIITSTANITFTKGRSLQLGHGQTTTTYWKMEPGGLGIKGHLGSAFSVFLLLTFNFLALQLFLAGCFSRTFRCFKSIISIHALYDGYNESLFAQQSLSIDTSGHCPM